MRTLYHYPLCPYSRKIRLMMAEKKLDFELEMEKFWERRPDYLQLNPAGQVPTLQELNGSVIADSHAIAEYLEEAYPERPLIPGNLSQKAEVRRLMAWFDDKFAREVSLNLIVEKTVRRHVPAAGGPNSNAIRVSKHHVNHHLEYIAWLVDRRKWLAGDELSVADLAAAAHLSSIDYLGDVPWEKHEQAKEWYMRLKSRPSFRGLLTDRIPGIQPVAHYAELDF